MLARQYATNGFIAASEPLGNSPHSCARKIGRTNRDRVNVFGFVLPPAGGKRFDDVSGVANILFRCRPLKVACVIVRLVPIFMVAFLAPWARADKCSQNEVMNIRHFYGTEPAAQADKTILSFSATPPGGKNATTASANKNDVASLSVRSAIKRLDAPEARNLVKPHVPNDWLPNFGYARLRHADASYASVCLGPVAGYYSAAGSPHFTTASMNYKSLIWSDRPDLFPTEASAQRVERPLALGLHITENV